MIYKDIKYKDKIEQTEQRIGIELVRLNTILRKVAN